MKKIWRQNKLWIILTILVGILTAIVLYVLDEIAAIKFAAYASVLFLFITLTPTRLIHIFNPPKPIKKFLNKISSKRRDIGITAATSMFMHVLIASNFYGGRRLSFYFKPQILPGLIAQIILVILLITSFFGLMKRFGKSWKNLHRIVWVTIPIILLHAVTANNWYSSPTNSLFAANIALFLIMFFAFVDLIIGFLKQEKLKPKIQTVAMITIGIIIAIILNLNITLL